MKNVQVIDVFSGCGGMSCGFVNAETEFVKYELLGGLDIDKHANQTYKKMLFRPAIEASAADLLDEQRLADALKIWQYSASKPLVLIGCAPCQGFSSHRKKDARSDARNGLVETFADIAVTLLPDVVIMENVPELLQTKHWDHFAAFRKKLEDAGYHVRAQIHHAAAYGVPQDRFRALVVASKQKSLAAMPIPSRENGNYRTVREAIGSLPPLQAGEADPNDPMHITSKHRKQTVDLIKKIPADGGSRSALPKSYVIDCHKTVDGFRDVYGRLWWDRPAVSITARCRTPSCGRFTHPEQHRGLTVREAALLQGFPEDWIFEGPFDDKFKQVGNAVPPLFAKAIAEALDQSWGGMNLTDASANDVVEPITKSFSSSLAGLKRKSRVSGKEVKVA